MEIGDTSLAYFPFNLLSLTCSCHDESTSAVTITPNLLPVLYVQDNGIGESPRLNNSDNQGHAVEWRGAHDLE